MDELKALFGENSLTYSEFEKKLGEASDIKLANLKSGNYVDKAKFERVQKEYNDYKAVYNEDLKANFDKISTEYNNIKAEQEKAKITLILNNKGVDSKFHRFITSEVNETLADNGGDFEKALTKYLKDNSQFVNAKSTYVDLQNGVGNILSDDEKINQQLRKLKG